MHKIYEVVRIKQIVQDITDELMNLKINSPHDAHKIVTHMIGDEAREVFLVICLNHKHQITAVHRCFTGTINASIASPREVFMTALLNNATAIIIAHNHPSLELQPSPEDLSTTRRLKEAGMIMGIELLDHLIVNAKGDYISLRERGYF
ncbi:MAG TPA: JAB domain-containing protein [Metabacillus sp.]|nr:JAB domain-containing protein [Metabacillus sp.]